MLSKNTSTLFLIIIAALLIAYTAFLQFSHPTLYDPDSYYHIATSNFMKELGFKYDFRWTQFSTFKDYFSDKDLLFHILTIPFLFLSENLVVSGKYAIIFFNILFFLTYIFILKKYLPNSFVAIFLIFPFLSVTFSFYFLLLRSVTLANILTILAIYLLIKKKSLLLFFLTFLYTLAHISFFTVIAFALICELARYVFYKELHLKNIYVVILGSLIGCIVHPNFPNNFLSLHLNAVLVPFYTIIGSNLDLGVEFLPYSTKYALIFNCAIFLSINLLIWVSLTLRKRISMPTAVWFGCCNLYLILAFLSSRYWYPVNVLFFVFLASCIKDWTDISNLSKVTLKAKVLIIACIATIFAFSSIGLKFLKKELKHHAELNAHYEDMAHFMNQNIPSGQTIYHAAWSDSPFFICLNPKNNYLVVLDPIYMFHRYPKESEIYRLLRKGEILKPHEVLSKVFGVNYGYTRKDNKLYDQIKKDPDNFKIIYENNLGVVFEIIRSS